jgi:ArsR family transcriptional regulator, arsenate/arsenite/antimonite-responsive transcriptional repressor
MEPELVEVCCEPLLAGALTNAEAEDLASVFKVLADPARLRLLSMIAAAGESCACDLVEPVGRSQPTVSHHLAALTEAGLLAREKRGRWVWYQIVPERFIALQRALQPRATSPIDSVAGNSPVTM